VPLLHKSVHHPRPGTIKPRGLSLICGGMCGWMLPIGGLSGCCFNFITCANAICVCGITALNSKAITDAAVTDAAKKRRYSTNNTYSIGLLCSTFGPQFIVLSAKDLRLPERPRLLHLRSYPNGPSCHSCSSIPR